MGAPPSLVGAFHLREAVVASKSDTWQSDGLPGSAKKVVSIKRSYLKDSEISADFRWHYDRSNFKNPQL